MRKMPDPFDTSRRAFEALVSDLEAAPAGALTQPAGGDDRAPGREELRQLLPDHLDLRAVREEQAMAANGEARRVKRGHHRALATVFRTVTVRRCAFRAPGAGNACPSDAALSLPTGRHSHGLQRRAVLEAVRGSFDAATAMITRCGKVAGKRQVEALVAAGDIDSFTERGSQPPARRRCCWCCPWTARAS
jgi:hypothetical protein